MEIDPRTTLTDLAARARAGEVSAAERDWTGPLGHGYRRSAVMILFTPTAARPAAPPPPPGVDVFLVKRADHLRHHPGEISLPGGRIEDDDADEAAAALRELQEETGLDPAVVEVLGQLTPQLVPISRNLVTPVLGWSSAVGDMGAVEPGEVVHTLRVPVAELLDPAARAGVRVPRHVTPGFATAVGWVWGFTGLLLDHVFTELGWTVPWDRSRELAVVLDGGRALVVDPPTAPAPSPDAR